MRLSKIAGRCLITLVVPLVMGAWKAVPSPNPAGSASDSRLPDVAATSANSVWAVGYAGSQSLAVHCC